MTVPAYARNFPVPAVAHDPEPQDRLPAARASACEQLARGIGFVHACARCEAERLPGSVCGFFMAEGLRRHAFEVHGLEGAP